MLISMATILLVASLGLCIYCSYYYPEANFYLLPTRAWELLIGALPAIVGTPRELPRWFVEMVSWIGLTAIVIAIFWFDRATRFPGSAALLPCAGAAAIMWMNSPKLTSVGKLLALTPLVFIGLISYSLYLWHWPLLVFPRLITPTNLTIPASLMGSFVLAILSWRYVETPFRRRVVFKGRVGILTYAGITTLALVAIGFSIHKSQGFPSRFSAQALAYANASSEMGKGVEVELVDVMAGKFIKLGPVNQPLPPKVFVWGDSHAMVVLPLLNELCMENDIRGLAATHSSLSPLLDLDKSKENSDYRNAIIDFIQKEHLTDVILVSRWSQYGLGRLKHDCLLKTLAALKKIGARTWILRQVPRPGIDVPTFLAYGVVWGCQDPEGPVCPLVCFRKDLVVQNQIFQNIPVSDDATVLDPTKFFMRPDGNLILAEGGKALYIDDNHLSVAGAMRLRPLFQPIFADLAKSR